MPIRMYKDYSYSYAPSPRTYNETVERKISLSNAFQMVVEGKLNATEVFNQLPKEVQKIINDVCLDSYGKDLERLPNNKQKNVFEMLLGALEIARERTHQKRWWQFWK